MNRNAIIAALQSRKIDFDPNAATTALNTLLCRSWLVVNAVTKSEDAEDGEEAYEFDMTINGQIGTDYYGENGFSAKQFQDEIKPFAGKRGLKTCRAGPIA